MSHVARLSTTTRRRTFVTTGAAVVVLLLVVGFAFVNSTTMSRVARDARSLHWTDAVAGTARLALAQADHALTLAEIGTGGVSSADVARSVEQLDTTYQELVVLADENQNHTATPALARFISPVEATIVSLENGEVAEARAEFDTSLQTAHTELSAALDTARATLQASVDSATASTAGWIEFALVFALPLCVAVASFIASRRWVAAVVSRSDRKLLKERESMRLKQAFVAELSRELRTPLTAVVGFAQILSHGETRGAEATKETAQLIANEAAEMTRIVDDLLVASSLDSMGVELEDSATRVGDVIEVAVAPFEQAGVTIARQPSAAVARTDPARLRHVLTNLVANAVQHGGPEISLDVTMGDSTVDIEVADNGPGLPQDDTESTLARVTQDGPLLVEGSGLGLPVASRLTSLMGGGLRYQRYGGRTYFVVTLPADPGVDGTGEGTSVADMIRTLSSSS